MSEVVTPPKTGLSPRKTGPLPPPPLRCPQCKSPIAPGDRFCHVCGVDLAFATLLAEREVLSGIPAAPNEPYVADAHLPRLGEYLLRNGTITQAQLEQALHQQAQQARHGRQQTIGQTLLELGAVSRKTLDQALVQQIQELQNALLDSNRELERRVAERTAELRRALERMAELNQLKANFVSNVSHELRTPLAQIKGYASLLADNSLGAVTGEQSNALAVVLKASDRLQQLVDDLIQYAASARGEMTLNLAQVFLQRTVSEALAASIAKAAKGQVELHSQVPGSLPPVMADEEKLRWVIFQLMDNAIKFTPQGGHVIVSAQSDGHKVRVTVADTGIGIPAERLAELFEPFHQLDGSSTRRYGGTGLGLALVKRIVEAHDGEVSVDSAVDQGSTFAIDLPQVKPS
jgi:signal transduction histidine kinase